MVKTKKTAATKKRNTQQQGQQQKNVTAPSGPKKQQQSRNKESKNRENNNGQSKHGKGGRSNDGSQESHPRSPEPSFSQSFEFPLCGYCDNLQRIIDTTLETLKIQGTAQSGNFYLVLKELAKMNAEIGDCCYPPYKGESRRRSRSTHTEDDESSSGSGKFYGDVRDIISEIRNGPNPLTGTNNNNNNSSQPPVEALLQKQ
jgi:hypothetical protein